MMKLFVCVNGPEVQAYRVRMGHPDDVKFVPVGAALYGERFEDVEYSPGAESYLKHAKHTALWASDILLLSIERPPAEYPEHEKLHAVRDHSQAIGEFLDWTQCEGVHFGRYDDSIQDGQVLQILHYQIPDLLAEYFGIDLDTLESEKRAMLDAQREANDES